MRALNYSVITILGSLLQTLKFRIPYVMTAIFIRLIITGIT